MHVLGYSNQILTLITHNHTPRIRPRSARIISLRPPPLNRNIAGRTRASQIDAAMIIIVLSRCRRIYCAKIDNLNRWMMWHGRWLYCPSAKHSNIRCAPHVGHRARLSILVMRRRWIVSCTALLLLWLCLCVFACLPNHTHMHTHTSDELIFILENWPTIVLFRSGASARIFVYKSDKAVFVCRDLLDARRRRRWWLWWMPWDDDYMMVWWWWFIDEMNYCWRERVRSYTSGRRRIYKVVSELTPTHQPNAIATRTSFVIIIKCICICLYICAAPSITPTLRARRQIALIALAPAKQHACPETHKSSNRIACI